MPIIKKGLQKELFRLSSIEQAMLLHASVHWKDGAAADLWSMAISYATYM